MFSISMISVNCVFWDSVTSVSNKNLFRGIQSAAEFCSSIVRLVEVDIRSYCDDSVRIPIRRLSLRQIKHSFNALLQLMQIT